MPVDHSAPPHLPAGAFTQAAVVSVLTTAHVAQGTADTRKKAMKRWLDRLEEMGRLNRVGTKLAVTSMPKVVK
jgi:hypothetical protein